MNQKNAVVEDIASVESRINDTKLSARSWLELTEEYLDNAFNAKNIMQEGSAEEKRKLILSVGENLILKDKELKFSFKKPYDVLLLPKYRTNVLPG